MLTLQIETSLSDTKQPFSDYTKQTFSNYSIQG